MQVFGQATTEAVVEFVEFRKLLTRASSNNILNLFEAITGRLFIGLLLKNFVNLFSFLLAMGFYDLFFSLVKYIHWQRVYA